MSCIFAWVKNLVCFYLLLTVILNLLPKKNYQKYVRFFSGMLLTLLVTSPVLSLMGNEEILREKISQAGLFQELDNLKLDTKFLEDTQKERYLQEYEKALEMDVSRMAEEKQLAVSEAEVHLSLDYQVESIELTAAFVEEEGIFVHKASFADRIQEYPRVQELKQELMEFYRLNETQVSIEIE
ncbi:hypothetical protein D3Z36_00035 [Lachnospiraceae bacterium]|nr:hypothetical protein [Lachnospiraceae bacterium]